MSTPLADVIREYGRAVEDGLITKEEAIAYLAANHDLTNLGAENVLKTWRTIHDRYQAGGQ